MLEEDAVPQIEILVLAVGMVYFRIDIAENERSKSRCFLQSLFPVGGENTLFQQPWMVLVKTLWYVSTSHLPPPPQEVTAGLMF